MSGPLPRLRLVRKEDDAMTVQLEHDWISFRVDALPDGLPPAALNVIEQTFRSGWLNGAMAVTKAATKGKGR